MELADQTAIGDGPWFRNTRMTAERRRVKDAMSREEEGLGPRAYRCLLQLADGEQPAQNDIDWLTDGVEEPAIAKMSDGACVLTALGRLLADAADRGDVEQMFAFTTMPELLERA